MVEKPADDFYLGLISWAMWEAEFPDMAAVGFMPDEQGFMKRIRIAKAAINAIPSRALDDAFRSYKAFCGESFEGFGEWAKQILLDKISL